MKKNNKITILLILRGAKNKLQWIRDLIFSPYKKIGVFSSYIKFIHFNTF